MSNVRMRRDMNLIRAILLALEDPEGEIKGIASDEAIQYHLRLMIEGGLLRGRINEYAGGYSILLNQNGPISNLGHDVLDTIRTDTVWSRVQARVAAVTGGVTLEVLCEVARVETRKLLGLEG